MSADNRFEASPGEIEPRPKMSKARKNKRSLKKLCIDISHYRLHRAAIEKLGWTRNITIIRIGKAYQWVPTPWWHQPSVRNWRYLNSEERHRQSDLRGKRMPLRRDPIVAGRLERHRLSRKYAALDVLF